MYNCLFYGSLRKGEYNESYFNKGGFNFISTVKIPGYKLYSLGVYPGIKRGDKSDFIICDAVQIEDKELFTSIHLMELSAGYSVDNIKLNLNSKEESYVLYVYDGKVEEECLVESGDWVKFNNKKEETICVD